MHARPSVYIPCTVCMHTLSDWQVIPEKVHLQYMCVCVCERAHTHLE